MRNDSGEMVIAADSLTRILWFRAAVIAVPIAGGSVLVVLVLMAARLLRRDADLPSGTSHFLVHSKKDSCGSPEKTKGCCCLAGCWPAKANRSAELV